MLLEVFDAAHLRRSDGAPGFCGRFLQVPAREIGRGAVAGIPACSAATSGGADLCPLPPPCPPPPAWPNLTCTGLACLRAVCPPCPSLSCPERHVWALLFIAAALDFAVAGLRLLPGRIEANFRPCRWCQRGQEASLSGVAASLRGLMPGSRILVRYVDAGE
ncbi:unnamed protein product, partial [Prorocentrum cordatum]